MPRSQRRRSEADIYHIIVRGEGRRILFEDDEDRECFLRFLKAALDRYGASIYAWCLMSNHAHMLLKAEFGVMPRLMQSLTSGYASYFNKRHDGVGHVFAGRYKSEAVDTDEYLLTVVRYIHFNPVKGGLSASCDYRWSSYGHYVSQTGFIDSAFVLDVCGGLLNFVKFHDVPESKAILVKDNGVAAKSRIDDDEAFEIAEAIVGQGALREVGSLSKGERDEAIAKLRRAGLTVRQVERFTGIGRGIVSRVKWKD